MLPPLFLNRDLPLQHRVPRQPADKNIPVGCGKTVKRLTESRQDKKKSGLSRRSAENR
jgi:hypothetical protein